MKNGKTRINWPLLPILHDKFKKSIKIRKIYEKNDNYLTWIFFYFLPLGGWQHYNHDRIIRQEVSDDGLAKIPRPEKGSETCFPVGSVRDACGVRSGAGDGRERS